ncbi:MAG TPA: histidine phosphatase family protein [Bryobacteraceae bacterium]|jgi:broad specificity phosphatase PhoE
MSDFYFIRHGQAGTRLEYDTLSLIGRQQARLLGEYLAKQGIAFSKIIAGGLQRHRETAQSVLEAYKSDCVAVSDLVIDPEWNEFDLDAVYKSVAPLMSKDSAEFAASYASMQQQVAEQGKLVDSVVNRRWNPCDGAVIKAWVTAQYPVEGQTWMAFRARIVGALTKLVGSNPDGNVAIFTSATPTAIALAQVMGLNERALFSLAGVMINSSMSVLRSGDGDLRVFNFNTVPHLDDASLRTHR